MKKLIAILAVTMILSFSTDKKFKVELTMDQWSKHFGKLEQIKTYMDQSSLPHRDVMYIISAIDSLEMDISPQIRAQLDTVGKSTTPLPMSISGGTDSKNVAEPPKK